MHIRTILNQLHPLKGFVYEEERFAGDQELPKAIKHSKEPKELQGTEESLETEDCEGHEGPKAPLIIPVRPKYGNKAICSCCGKEAPGYDTLPARLFQFVPFWGLQVFFEYRMRRVKCPEHGVKVEKVPWADGKVQKTNTYSWFIAHWAKQLPYEVVSKEFGTSWNSVYRCVEHAVDWGRERVDLSGVKSIGVDEISRAKGHEYVTLVYEVGAERKRLLWVNEDRKEQSLEGFFDLLGEDRSKQIEFVCSDMWKPFLNVIKNRASQAVQVLDRYHIMTHFSKAIDQIRAGEAKALAETGKGQILKNSRWTLLKRPENLTEKQEVKLDELVQYNLKSVRAYLLKEEFNQLWTYKSPAWAGKFLKRWTTRALRSRLEPMKKVARMIRRHQDLILNWFRAKGQVSNGTVEGFNGKARVCTKRAYGFRTYRCIEVALFHTLGDLPEQKFTHKFW